MDESVSNRPAMVDAQWKLRAEKAEAEVEGLREQDEDWRYQFAEQAFTAPDADWGAIFDSYKARHDDALAEVEQLREEKFVAAPDTPEAHRALLELVVKHVATIERLKKLVAENKTVFTTNDYYRIGWEDAVSMLRRALEGTSDESASRA